jgi:hypothetical protein
VHGERQTRPTAVWNVRVVANVAAVYGDDGSAHLARLHLHRRADSTLHESLGATSLHHHFPGTIEDVDVLAVVVLAVVAEVVLHTMDSAVVAAVGAAKRIPVTWTGPMQRARLERRLRALGQKHGVDETNDEQPIMAGRKEHETAAAAEALHGVVAVAVAMVVVVVPLAEPRLRAEWPHTPWLGWPLARRPTRHRPRHWRTPRRGRAFGLHKTKSWHWETMMMIPFLLRVQREEEKGVDWHGKKRLCRLRLRREVEVVVDNSTNVAVDAMEMPATEPTMSIGWYQCVVSRQRTGVAMQRYQLPLDWNLAPAAHSRRLDLLLAAMNLLCLTISLPFHYSTMAQHRSGHLQLLVGEPVGGLQ